jgi:3-dehydroquinate synthase
MAFRVSCVSRRGAYYRASWLGLYVMMNEQVFMPTITVHVAPGTYRVVIEEGVLGRAGKTLREEFPEQTRAFVVTVSKVRRMWGKKLQASLKAAGFHVEFLEMPDGEAYKKLATVEALAVRMSRHGADRKSIVVAFGGGVVGDTAGLLAALYMRGVDLVQVPTTLLAQVDASVGGKTGVDLKTGKNLVGAFHQPRLVITDTSVLSTLSTRQLRAGLYESLKCGVIGSPKLFEEIESKGTKLGARELESIVGQSVRMKAKIVAADERESGLRRVLNFGHTIGHALETESNYRRFLHGEAVAWGMIAATRLATVTNRLDTFSARRIIDAILNIGPLPKVTVRGKSILGLLQADKKTTDSKIHFVLPTKIGRVEIVNDVPETLMVAIVDELRDIAAA